MKKYNVVERKNWINGYNLFHTYILHKECNEHVAVLVLLKICFNCGFFWGEAISVSQFWRHRIGTPIYYLHCLSIIYSNTPPHILQQSRVSNPNHLKELKASHLSFFKFHAWLRSDSGRRMLDSASSDNALMTIYFQIVVAVNQYQTTQ